MSAERETLSAAPMPRLLTMQDRLLVAAHIESIAMSHRSYRVIADTVIDCVRCCDEFPECSHVLVEVERVDREEGRGGNYWLIERGAGLLDH